MWQIVLHQFILTCTTFKAGVEQNEIKGRDTEQAWISLEKHGSPENAQQGTGLTQQQEC
jgi:hypothetical protein